MAQTNAATGDPLVDAINSGAARINDQLTRHVPRATLEAHRAAQASAAAAQPKPLKTDEERADMFARASPELRKKYADALESVMRNNGEFPEHPDAATDFEFLADEDSVY